MRLQMRPMSRLVVLPALAATLLAQDRMIQRGPGEQSNSKTGMLPIVFEPNQGQAESDVRFLSRFGSSTVLLSDREARFVFTLGEKRRSEQPRPLPSPHAASIRMVFAGAKPNLVVEGVAPLTSRTNYYLGSADPFHAAHYERVAYRSVYPGIDLVYHRGKAGHLEHDFVIQPGGDPADIRLLFPGSHVSLDREGDLLVRAGRARMVQKRPVIYQETAAGHEEIAGGYRRLRHGEYGFQIAPYDHSRPLVIDPEDTFEKVGYVGGQGFTSLADFTYDPTTGRFYVSGETGVTFTGQQTFPPTLAPGMNAFVAEMNPDMTQMDWITIIGGPGGPSASLTVKTDHAGNIFAAGITQAQHFYVTSGSGNLNGQQDMCVFELNSDGNVIRSITLGGSGREFVSTSAMDSSDNFFVAGGTDSPDWAFGAPGFQQT